MPICNWQKAASLEKGEKRGPQAGRGANAKALRQERGYKFEKKPGAASVLGAGERGRVVETRTDGSSSHPRGYPGDQGVFPGGNEQQVASDTDGLEPLTLCVVEPGGTEAGASRDPCRGWDPGVVGQGWW